MTIQKIVDTALKESGLENTKIFIDYCQLEEDKENYVNYMYSSIISRKDIPDSSDSHFGACKKLYDFSESLKHKLPDDVKSDIYILSNINEYRCNVFPFILELRFIKDKNLNSKNNVNIPGQMSLF